MELTRTYYFDGELLEAADFIRDQQYFRDVTQAINKSLYTRGVASGLVLDIDNVSSGLAFDENGVTVVLADDASLPSPDTAQADGTYFVVLKYSDDLAPADGTDPNEQDLRSSHVISEIPMIDISQKSSVDLDDVIGVILGVVIVKDQAITSVGATGRQVATLTIQAPATKAVTEADAETAVKTAVQPALREVAPPPPAPPSDAEPIADALATLRLLTGVAFTAPDGRRRLSVRAREVEAALPALVRTDAEGVKAVASVELVGLLVEAVKTLAARVEQLERQGGPPSSHPEG